MPVAIALALVGTTDPQAVQIAVTGLSVGQTYRVTGTSNSGAWTWPVRGGEGTAAATSLVLSDYASPINTPVTYAVETSGTLAATSSPITVPFVGVTQSRYLLSSLDGRRTASFSMQRNGQPRDPQMRVEPFFIPGRPRPVTRYDRTLVGTRELRLRTTGVERAAMDSLIDPGGPLLLRTDGAVRDLDAVSFVIPTAAPNQLLDFGPDDRAREWTLTYFEIDDPEPETIVPTSTWDDFDSVYASSTWTSFDTEWTGQTWDLDFDREDWASRA